jgi:Tfp pilus assembly protein PilF
MVLLDYLDLSNGLFMECNKLAEAMKVLKEALLTDDDYRLGWQANIAMSYQDEAARQLTKDSYDKLHNISNKAAENFIKLLIL